MMTPSALSLRALRAAFHNRYLSRRGSKTLTQKDKVLNCFFHFVAFLIIKLNNGNKNRIFATKGKHPFRPLGMTEAFTASYETAGMSDCRSTRVPSRTHWRRVLCRTFAGSSAIILDIFEYRLL